MSQVETAAARRQQILDFLLANPGAKMAAIGASLESASRSRHHNTVRTMIEWGEVRVKGKPRCRQYWALVETTRPASEVEQVKLDNVRRANRAKQAQRVMRALRRRGRYVHVPGQQIRSQGGQGAIQ